MTDSAVTGVGLWHTMRFHAPFRAGAWLLFYIAEAPVTSGVRGPARAVRCRQAGNHAVSVVKEGLIRLTSGSQG